MVDWTTIIGAEAPLTWWQESARAVLIFAYGLLLVRLLGRRAFARWAALDIVVAIIAGSSLSRALTGNASLIATMVATALMMLLHRLGALAAASSRRVSWLVEGRPLHLLTEGRLNRARARRLGVSEPDLAEAARRVGLNRAEEGAAAVHLLPTDRTGHKTSDFMLTNDSLSWRGSWCTQPAGTGRAVCRWCSESRPWCARPPCAGGP